MKKHFIRKASGLFLAALLAVSLIGCGSKPAEEQTPMSGFTQEESVSEATSETSAVEAEETSKEPVTPKTDSSETSVTSAEETSEESEESSAEPENPSEPLVPEEKSEEESAEDPVEPILEIPEEAESFDGTYYELTYMKDGDQEYDEAILSVVSPGYLVLRNDGTGYIAFNTEEEPQELQWDDTYLIAGDTPIPYTLTDGKLRIEDPESGMVMEFTQKEMTEPTDPESLKDLPIEYDETTRAGYYTLLYVEEDGKVTDARVLAALGMEIYLVLNRDSTGTLVIYSTPTALQWNDDALLIEGDFTPYTYDSGKIVIDSGGSAMCFAYQDIPENAPVPLGDLDLDEFDTDGEEGTDTAGEADGEDGASSQN